MSGKQVAQRPPGANRGNKGGARGRPTEKKTLTDSDSSTDGESQKQRKNNGKANKKKKTTADDNTMELDNVVPEATASTSTSLPANTAENSNTDQQAPKSPNQQTPEFRSTNDQHTPTGAAHSDTPQPDQPDASNPNQTPENDDMIVNENNEEPIEDDGYTIERYTAYIDKQHFADLKLSLPQLRNRITEQINELPGFLRIRTGKNRYDTSKLLVDFNQSEGYEELIGNPVESLNNAVFKEYVSRQQIYPEIERQLNVQNIPLFLVKEDLRLHFSKVGTIERINLTPNGPFQRAVITFEHPDALQDYKQLLWMAFIKGHAVTVFPRNMSSHEFEHRQAYKAILTGFHYNTLAADVLPLITDYNIKNIVFPRIAFQYRQRPWAYVSFDSQVQKDNAMERTTTFNGRKLFWVEPTYDPKTKRSTTKPLCNECGSPEHMLKDCDKRRKNTRNPRVQSTQWESVLHRYNRDERAKSRTRSQSRTRFQNDRSFNAARTRAGFSYANAAKSNTKSQGNGLNASIHAPNNNQPSWANHWDDGAADNTAHNLTFNTNSNSRNTFTDLSTTPPTSSISSDEGKQILRKLKDVTEGLEHVMSRLACIDIQLQKVTSFSKVIASKIGVDPNVIYYNDDDTKYTPSKLFTKTMERIIDDNDADEFYSTEDNNDNNEMEQDREEDLSSYNHPVEAEKLKQMDKSAVVDECLKLLKEQDEIRYQQHESEEKIKDLSTEIAAYKDEILKMSSIIQDIQLQVAPNQFTSSPPPTASGDPTTLNSKQ
jgi:hypothetical protein